MVSLQHATSSSRARLKCLSLCSRAVHPQKVRVFVAASDSGQQSQTRYRRLLRCVGWCTSIRTAVSRDRSSCAAVSLALLCAVVSLARLCGRPPHLCILSRLRLRPSCERLPCGIPSTECFVWSLHAHSLSLSLISSSSVVCSRSAPLHCAATMPRLLHHIMSQAVFFFFNETHSIS